MKNIINNKSLVAIVMTVALLITSCKKTIDLEPISNVGAEAYYKNFNEVNSALTGCYNGMQGALLREWMFTELRSDNSKQGVPNSSAVANLELNTLDMFALNPFHERVYDHWLATYKNIRAINYVLRSVGAKYEGGEIVVGAGTADLTEVQRNKILGEALFLRAYHYFNLVRLFGSVFLVTEPVDPKVAKQQPRSSIQELYNFIIADLSKANEVLPNTAFSGIPSADLGRANLWSAKALLAKVYLTLDQPNNALPLLNQIITSSGYGLLSSYGDVFSITNEMNREILFAVRYRAGGFNLGSPFANQFAPLGSGNAVVNNGASGLNYPTEEFRTIYKVGDNRKGVTIGEYTPNSSTNVPYVKKFISQVVLAQDAENDFPVIRYSDVLLMKAEALGFTNESVDLINEVRARAGALDYGSNTDFTTRFYKYPASGPFSLTSGTFDDALLNERRIELAFENQRYFDIIRAGKAVEIIRNHFAEEFDVHYSKLQEPTTLEQLQARVTQDRLLLPIPQKERDTNDQIDIGQNPGY